MPQTWLIKDLTDSANRPEPKWELEVSRVQRALVKILSSSKRLKLDCEEALRSVQ
jgi:hypothetical protein